MTEKKNLNQEQLEKVSGGDKFKYSGYCKKCKKIEYVVFNGGEAHCTKCGGTDIVLEP